MTSYAGWYIGRTESASVASAKAGGSTAVIDTVFQWPGNSGASASAKPTVETADITGLTAIASGPYTTQALALKAAGQDPNTSTATAGEGKPGVDTSSAGSSNGHVPSILGDIASIWGTLTSQNLWIRAAKIIFGGTLVVVGVAKMAGAGGVAGKAVKIAPLL